MEMQEVDPFVQSTQNFKSIIAQTTCPMEMIDFRLNDNLIRCVQRLPQSLYSQFQLRKKKRRTGTWHAQSDAASQSQSCTILFSTRERFTFHHAVQPDPISVKVNLRIATPRQSDIGADIAANLTLLQIHKYGPSEGPRGKYKCLLRF